MTNIIMEAIARTLPAQSSEHQAVDGLDPRQVAALNKTALGRDALIFGDNVSW